MQHRTRQLKIYMLLAGMLLLLLFVFLNIVFALLLHGLEQQAETIEQQRKLVGQQIDNLQEYKELQEQTETVDSILAAVLEEEPNWHELLFELGADFPAAMQLYNLSSNNEDAIGELLLQGTAPEQETFRRWIDTLLELPQLGELEYRFDVVGGAESITAIDFQVTAELLPFPKSGSGKEQDKLD